MIDQTIREPRKRNNHQPRLGLALSGGGARGLAHIGVLKVLARENIPVSCLAGTSMGGLIAAAYASGMDPDDIESEALAITRWRSLAALADLKVPRQGLFRGERLLAYFERQFSQRTFDELDLPLALTAVDLNTGQEIVLRTGTVALAVRATVAVPGLLMPVELDGRRLADGGLLNNIPTDLVHSMGATTVIAVDVAPWFDENWRNGVGWTPQPVSGTLQVLTESVGAMRSAIVAQRLQQASPDVMICPDIPANVNIVAGYNRVEELIDAGQRATEVLLPQIQEQMHLEPREFTDIPGTSDIISLGDLSYTELPPSRF